MGGHSHSHLPWQATLALPQVMCCQTVTSGHCCHVAGHADSVAQPLVIVALSDMTGKATRFPHAWG